MNLGECEKGKTLPRPAVAWRKNIKFQQMKYISIGNTGRNAKLCPDFPDPGTATYCPVAACPEPMRDSAYEKAAAIPAPASTTMAHQPKTTPIQVPRLSLVRLEKPIPLSTSVQMVKRSREVASV